MIKYLLLTIALKGFIFLGHADKSKTRLLASRGNDEPAKGVGRLISQYEDGSADLPPFDGEFGFEEKEKVDFSNNTDPLINSESILRQSKKRKNEFSPSNSSQNFSSNSSSSDDLISALEEHYDDRLNQSLSQEPLCPRSNETPNFVRHKIVDHQIMESAASFVRKTGSLDACLDICRQNTEPFEGKPFQCHGFTYQGRGSEVVCAFYSNRKRQQHEATFSHHASKRKVNLRINFFERICIEVPRECEKHPFIFETPYGPSGDIYFLATELLNNTNTCLEECVSKNQHCSLADLENHGTDNSTCHLLSFSSNEGKKNLTGGLIALAADQNISLFENKCVKASSGCEKQRFDFVRTKSVELPVFMAFIGTISLRECLRRCIDEESTLPCHAVQYSEQNRECYMVIDHLNQTFHPTVASEDLDMYEPVCLNSSNERSCPTDYLFTKTQHISLTTENPELMKGTKEIVDVSVEKCMDACISDNSCLSFLYSSNPGDPRFCRLLSFTRHSQGVLTVVQISPIHYYELACRIPIELTSETFSPLSNNPENTTFFGPSSSFSEHNDFESSSQSTKLITDLSLQPIISEQNRSEVIEVVATTITEPTLGISFGESLQLPLTTKMSAAPEDISMQTRTNGEQFSKTTEESSQQFEGTGISTTNEALTPGLSLLSSTTSTFDELSISNSNPTPNNGLEFTIAPQEEIEMRNTTVILGQCQPKAPRKLRLILAVGRTLRWEYRNLQLVNVKNATHCEYLCASSVVIECITFAYNRISRDCLLSTTNLSDNNELYAKGTQSNSNYDLYTFKLVGGVTCPQPSTTSSTTIVSDIPTESVDEAINQTTQNVGSSSPTFSSGTVLEVESILENFIEPTSSLEISSFESSDSSESFAISTLKPTLSNDQIVSSTLFDPLLKFPIGESGLPFIKGTGHLANFVQPEQRKNELLTNSLMSKGNENSERQTSKKVSRDQITISAICSQSDINVTFVFANKMKYNGVVYAIDRFSQCNLRVKNESKFSFHIPLPMDRKTADRTSTTTGTNICGAIESGSEVSVSLVLSNDLILPYEVITKEDIIVEISCDYSIKPTGQVFHDEGTKNMAVVKGSVEFNYPRARHFQSSSSKSIVKCLVSSEILQTDLVRLNIQRNGTSVNKALLGEPLTLSIYPAVSNDNPESVRLYILGCNVSRMGGNGPDPEPIGIIGKYGCSLWPKMIGNFAKRLNQNSFEANLTTFRIDGGDNLDFSCSVFVCTGSKCNEFEERNERDECKQETFTAKDSFNGYLISIHQWLRISMYHDSNDDSIELMIGEDKNIDVSTNEISSKIPKQESAGFLKQLAFSSRENSSTPPSTDEGSVKLCLNFFMVLSILCAFSFVVLGSLIVFVVRRCRQDSQTAAIYSSSYGYPIAPSLSGTEMNSQFYVSRMFDRYNY